MMAFEKSTRYEIFVRSRGMVLSYPMARSGLSVFIVAFEFIQCPISIFEVGKI